MTRRSRVFGALCGSFGVASVTYARLSQRSETRWWRYNYRECRVTLAQGPAVAFGATAGLLWIAVTEPRLRRRALAVAAAGSSAAAIGWYDDQHREGTVARGLAGHFSALANREVTPGVVKVVGLTCAGALATAVGPNRWRWTDAALVAGCANLINLFDVRPARATKVTVLAAAPAVATGDVMLVTALAALASTMPAELTERCMLGDTGANAIGAIVGARVAMARNERFRRLVLALVVGLTVSSEFVSFSDVIARHELLRRFDEMGRQ